MRPPPDDPAQSERFVKAATELMVEDGGLLFERAMQSIAKPGQALKRSSAPTIQASEPGKKKPAGTIRKR
jgi:hypothetical protein